MPSRDRDRDFGISEGRLNSCPNCLTRMIDAIPSIRTPRVKLPTFLGGRHRPLIRLRPTDLATYRQTSGPSLMLLTRSLCDEPRGVDKVTNNHYPALSPRLTR